jgi:chemotaxis protein MotB
VSRKKKQAEEEAPGAPEWMNTYGDMVTLLLTFFVLLFSFSTIDAEKWRALAGSLRGGKSVLEEPSRVLEYQAPPDQDQFKAVPSPSGRQTPAAAATPSATATPMQSPTPEPTPEPTKAPVKTAAPDKYKYSKAFQSDLKDAGLGISISRKNNLIYVRIYGSVLFDPGLAVIKPGAQSILDKVGAVLNEHSKRISGIRIEGHTDNLLAEGSPFETNWHLSTTRSSNVLVYLLKKSGLSGSNAVSAGYGEKKPITSNETQEGRDKNNRVDIIVTTKTS